MRKACVFFLIFYFIHCFSQTNIVFKPHFEANKPYFLSIDNNCGVLYRGKLEKSPHDIHTVKKIELKFQQEIKQEKYYSWKFIEQKNIDTKYNYIDVMKDIEIIFKTTSDGKYLGISNLSNLENQIRTNVDKYVTQETLKKTNNKSFLKRHYAALKEDPSAFINNLLELEIIHYFSYYNVTIDLGIENFKTERINFPFRGAYVPVDEVCNLIKLDKGYILEVDSKFDKNAVTDKHWDSLISGPEFLKIKFKDNFDLQLTEKYIFNSLTGNVDELEIQCNSKSFSGKNYTAFNKFIYKLSE